MESTEGLQPAETTNIIEHKIQLQLNDESSLSVEEIRKQTEQKLRLISDSRKKKTQVTIFLWGYNGQDKGYTLIPQVSPAEGLFEGNDRTIKAYPPIIDITPVSARALLELRRSLGIKAQDYPDKDLRSITPEIFDWNKVLPTNLRGVYYHESFRTLTYGGDMAASFVTVNKNYQNRITRKKGEVGPVHVLRKLKPF